ncbi:VWA domain-containing protein [Leptospira fletcheri]|uniref:VWA domain-containing protein n=2 Tax=Leptospira fletcheri TaxID=2484981 RepID=A0A4V3JDZ2_9LEPT|nr:VWA domain-containing protein [Leptospira fletcheri]
MRKIQIFLLRHSYRFSRMGILLFVAYWYALSLPIFASDLFPGSTDSEERAKLFVLDASGSMNEYLGIYQKIHLAKKHVKHYVDGLSERTTVGFIAYGNRLPGCQSSRLYQPFEDDKSKFRNKLYGLTPSGATPLAESIRVAGTYLSGKKRPVELILVTDGIESCYGDPEKELKILQSKGIDFRMNIIGLGLKPEERAAMQSLAKLGKGSYFNVDGDGDFQSAVEKLLHQETVSKISENSGSRPTGNSSPIRILNWERTKVDENKNGYTVTFEFDHPGLKDRCITMNLKSPGTDSLKPTQLGKLRPENPEKVSRLETVCPSQSAGRGKFSFVAVKGIGTSAVLELWDMSGVPQVVGISQEVQIGKDFTEGSGPDHSEN